MQVFKAYLKVLKRKAPVCLIWITVFVVISVIISRSATNEKSYSDSQLKICIFDEDNTEASRAFSEFIGSKHELVELENDKDTILDALYYEEVDYALIIKKGYEESVINGITDDLLTNYQVHESYSCQLAENLIDSYLKTLKSYIIMGNDIQTALKNTEDAFKFDVEVKMETFSKENALSPKEFSEDFSQYFNYMPYIIMMVVISALCPVLLVFNKKELRNRTNCSSVPANKQTIQIFLGSLIFIVGVWLVFMIVGAVLNERMYTGKGLYAVLNSFVFTIISAGIAILISSFSPSSTGVTILSNIIGLGMSFLCGVFVPQSLLGENVLKAAKFLPAYWYVKANGILAGTTGEVFTTEKFFKYIGVELFFAVAIYAAALAVTKAKHDKAE